jgi:alkylation response protein AidB-like acyl-CoA dehydrogenase
MISVSGSRLQRNGEDRPMSALDTRVEIQFQGPVTADSPELQKLIDVIGEDALERDRDRILPFAMIDLIRQARLGALRIPRALGGGGSSLHDLFEVVIRLADADPNVAHIIRNHYAFVESRLRLPNQGQPDRWLNEIAQGSIFGLAAGELGSSPAGQNLRDAELVPDGNGYILNGTKYYSTGSIYSDWIVVRGTIPDLGPASVVVPANREGVFLDDDWDGMGQRLTGSGTTRLVDVRVSSDEVVINPAIDGERSPYQSTFPNLYLTAIIAGVLRNVQRDAVALIKRRDRSFYHAPTEIPGEDPILQEVIGRISSSAFAAEAMVLAAADAMDVAAASYVRGVPDYDLAHAASLKAVKAKVVVDELSAKVAGLIFDVGGASATKESYLLDRHWRNVRTLSSHNPASYKARAVGDFAINGTPLPNGAYF